MNPGQLSLLAAFVAAKIDFAIVGGVAVNAHGYLRATHDIDLFIRPTLENARAAFAVLLALGVPLDGLEPNDLLDDIQNLRFGPPEDHVDILSSIGEMNFDQVWANRTEIQIQDLSVPFISLPDLLHTPDPALFAPQQRIHFIGIGGIGMSGIAEILLTLGYEVSGSDLRESPTTARLQHLGATVFIGHAAPNAAASDVVVTSTAVARDNPEVLEARARKIPIIQRAEMLAELMRLKYGIAVAGMHGKTTTTSMIAAVLAGGDLDPTVVVGGRVDALGSNARLGRSQYLVAEADESDRSFLKLPPILAVVTNLDREHMDTYADLADIENAFLTFMDKVPFYGAVTACIDDPMLRSILPRVTRKIFTYGESPDADFRLRRLPSTHTDTGFYSTFEVDTRGLVLGPFHLRVPGRHNVLNAAAAIAIGVQLGIAPEAIALGIANFSGVDRRFQHRGAVHGITVIDDYGHHPTEIRATLAAAREAGFTRVLVLFQPHRYTRTRDLMPDFATAFGDADAVEVLDIYAASEQPIEGVTAQHLADAIASHAARIHYAPSLDEAIARLAADARPGDCILTLGAGSVSQAGPLLLEALGASAR